MVNATRSPDGDTDQAGDRGVDPASVRGVRETLRPGLPSLHLHSEDLSAWVGPACLSAVDGGRVAGGGDDGDRAVGRGVGHCGVHDAFGGAEPVESGDIVGTDEVEPGIIGP